MTRSQVTGVSLLPSFPQTLEGERILREPATANGPTVPPPPVLSALRLTDFAYVRWLGDRKGIEKQTTTWDKTVVDRTNDLKSWVEVFKSLVSNTKVLKIFAFSNNHYAGHGPATAKLFMDLWNKEK